MSALSNIRQAPDRSSELLAEAVSFSTWSSTSMPGVANVLNSGYQWFSGPDDDLSLLSCQVNHDAFSAVVVEAWWDMSRDAGPELTTLEMQVWDVTDTEIVIYTQQTRNATQDYQGGEHVSKFYRPRTSGMHEYRFHMKTPGSGVDVLGQASSDGTSNGYLTAYKQSFGFRVWRA